MVNNRSKIKIKGGPFINNLKRVVILVAVFALFIPALSTAKMTKHDEKTTSTQMVDISRATAIELVIKMPVPKRESSGLT